MKLSQSISALCVFALSSICVSDASAASFAVSGVAVSIQAVDNGSVLLVVPSGSTSGCTYNGSPAAASQIKFRIANASPDAADRMLSVALAAKVANKALNFRFDSVATKASSESEAMCTVTYVLAVN